MTGSSTEAFRRPGPGGIAELPRDPTTIRASIEELRRLLPRPGPGPQELPVALTRTDALMREMLQLRQRLHQIETQQFVNSFRGIGVGGPAELPVPELGDGSGVIPIPRPQEIAELPVFETLSGLVDRLVRLEARLVEIETQLQVMSQGAGGGG